MSQALAIDIPTRKAVSRVSLRLPMPPSVNQLWRPTGRRLILTEAYKAWRRDAGWTLAQQRPGRISGAYCLMISACRASKLDLGNVEKAISDLLQQMRVIDNDRLAESISLKWGDHEGVIIRVEAA